MKSKSEKKIKWKYFISGVTASLLVVALLYFAFMYIPSSTAPDKPDTIQTIRKAKEIQRLIDEHYLGDVDESSQTDGMYKGQVSGLGDKYSHYYTKEEFEELRKNYTGEYTGIGVTFSQDSDSGSFIVLKVEKNSPADKAGIRKDDRIIEVAGKAADTMTTSGVADLIQKKKKDGVELVIRRAGTADFKVTVIPSKVEMTTVTGEMKTAEIGYIKISQFSSVTTKQYEDIFQELSDQGMKKLVIDLRDNPGGLVSSCTQILDEILPNGIIVYEEDKDGNRKYHEGTDDRQLNMPLVLLVNGNSASASEIFTGAIKDYKIGKIIGTKTFGKGIVQNTFTLPDGSVLQLTTTHYFTPDGNNINGEGITPDVVVEQTESTTGDAQLQRALDTLG